MLKLITKYPIAYESRDHTNPAGTKDLSVSAKLTKKLIDLVGGPDNLRLLDIGCAGGTFVEQLNQAGAIACGIEGSDYGQKNNYGAWPRIPHRLFTCDATKPFYFKDEYGCAAFNVCTSHEVLEHIQEPDIDQFLTNVLLNLTDDGYFITTISHDVQYHHVTLRPYRWWLERISRFFVQDEKIENYISPDWLRGEHQGVDSGSPRVVGNSKFVFRKQDRFKFKV